MSTRSAIIRKTEDGNYEGIYCHFDGYESGVGQTLHDHYQDPIKVKQLLSLGDISSLGERVDPVGEHSFENREEGTTTAYCRDRGEPYHKTTGPDIDSVASKIGHNGYVYVYDNGWTVNRESLEDVLKSPIIGQE